MTSPWKLQDAKSRFSELVNDALQQGPQIVTRHGKDTVVVLSVSDYRELQANKPDFKTLLLSCPKLEDGITFERQQDYPRDIDL